MLKSSPRRLDRTAPRALTRLSLLALPAALMACQPPPPAPEGLDASASYMMREFYADDPLFEAGLLGFMNWFDDEGFELLGLGSTLDTTDAFTVGTLSEDDIGYLPYNRDREIENAKGVVSLAEMDCDIEVAENLLVRLDQDSVFPEDWREGDDGPAYVRTYLNSRTEYQDAMSSRTFPSVPDAVDRFGADFTAGDHNGSFLFTENMANPASVLGADMPPYPLFLEFRHGDYDINGTDTRIFSIITWNSATVSGPNGDNHLHQSYSIEINAERAGGKTLRMLAVWAEPEGAGLAPDDPIVLNYAVNKSLQSSAKMSAICSGEEDIPDEP